MSIAHAMLAEFRQEAATTRRFLERLPADKLDWQPHPKSMTAGKLAMHIATIPGGLIVAAVQDGMSMSDFKGPPQPTSVEEIVARLDDGVAAVEKMLPTIDDAKMAENWRLTQDGESVMSMPRVTLLRSIMLNHWYHHRGQFGVYLRLLGADVPSSYGPSGDEVPDAFKKKQPAAA